VWLKKERKGGKQVIATSRCLDTGAWQRMAVLVSSWGKGWVKAVDGAVYALVEGGRKGSWSAVVSHKKK